jgi:diguanylate cyclase (GGDEF)-like protein/PAS domain S-box-containing protein
MQIAPKPDNEADRLAALQALKVLDSVPEAEFDALVQAASLVCGTPITLISLVDADRQWFKASIGLPGVTETPRDLAFCAHAVLGDELLEVADATLDPRFADNPLVTGVPDIRFYAGAPLRLRDGSRVGTLCVIDHLPRQLGPEQRQVLRCLADAVVAALEGRRALLEQQRLAHELVLSEERQRRLYEATPVMLDSIDADGRLIAVSDAWLNRMGYERAEVIGRRAADFLTPQSREYSRSIVLPAFFATGSCDQVEYQMVTRSGEVIEVLLSAILERDAAGQPLRSLAVTEDVTPRRRAERALRDERQRLANIIEGTHAGTWEWNVQTGEVRFNERLAQIVGCTLAELAPLTIQTWRLLVHQDDLVRSAELLAQHFSGQGERYECEMRMRHRAGHWVWVLTRGRLMTWTAHGEPEWMYGTHLDISESRRLADDLAEQHERLRVTLQSISDAVITTDAQGGVVWLNPAAERMTGWSADAGRGRPLAEVLCLIDEQTRQPVESPVAACMDLGRPTRLDAHAMLVTPGGAEHGIEATAAPIRNARGELLGAVLVCHDVTEPRRLAREMSHRASHDALTGLVNRAELEARLRRTLQKAQTEHSRHALLYIDLDQFKLVNDACGHTVGDQLLQQVARLFMDVVRSRDTVARLGGDEFAVILEHCSAEQALRVAQQLCDRMEDFRFVHEERRFRIGASIGLVPIDSRWTGTAAILQAADTSCYAAKEAGRNRVHAWFDTDLTMRARHGEMQWASRIEQALDDNRFVLYAQRFQALQPGAQGLCAEVLLRKLDKTGALVPPGAFLPAAERFHLASRIDRWVLREVLAWMRAAPDLGFLDKLSVNLSGQSIGDGAFHCWAFEVLCEAGPLICQRLCFEITETAAVTNLTDAALFIEQVRELGVRIALDDFGAGASSFGYLKRLPVDYLKIDGQFIRDLVTDPLDEAAVRCFVDVAKVVGVQTVAEFVDQPAVLERLRQIGVDFAQGFLVHRPAPLHELLGPA